ncbi:MAG: hypothetical protein M0C28_37650 [Candidatus Moduliflexus flocculans]|nr:hypothetical protein [Candidatus Moduliflexus flocculans]
MVPGQAAGRLGPAAGAQEDQAHHHADRAPDHREGLPRQRPADAGEDEACTSTRPSGPSLHRLAGIKLKKTFGGKLRFFGIGGAGVAPDVEAFLLRSALPLRHRLRPDRDRSPHRRLRRPHRTHYRS